MVIMDTYYSSDRLQKIWLNIDHLHLSYLEMEESPEKLEHRMQLEGCIREFLCMASHSQKFFLRETAEVLHRSASSKKDFSGYKAATGWNALQLYAGNLLSQPWRKEYRQVNTFCGFYKHQIEANLVGAELMFEAMGYKHYGNGILILDGPICPDTVTNVSKDCLIAYVECQILKAIWEEISPTFKISWWEVLEFRKTHLCSPEQSIRALTYQYHQKQYQAQNAEGRCQAVPPLVPFPPMMQQLPYVYGACPNNYATYGHLPYPLPVHYPPQHPVKPPPYTNGYYCTNGFMGQSHPNVYGYSVPTGQLIELDHGYETVRKGGPANNHHPHDVAAAAAAPSRKGGEAKEGGEDFEDWDYVYRNLESQGYSKDLGERGDILSPGGKHHHKRPTNLDEAMNSLAVTDRPLKIAEALERYEARGPEREAPKKGGERRQSQSSSYENLTEPKRAPPKVPAKAKTLPPQEGGKERGRRDRWECKACTYINENAKEICEMCSKSKVIVEQQMEIGGPQCSQCTLVNSKDAKKCQACDASLKDSPTYI